MRIEMIGRIIGVGKDNQQLKSRAAGSRPWSHVWSPIDLHLLYPPI